MMIVGILCSVVARSQLCSGSLGDPVALITFGSGATQGPALPPGKTNYNFIGHSCPADGAYTIVASTSNCFGATWHNIPQDRTINDNNGYFMLVNASVTPGVFYVDTVSSLCGGTTYEFSAYIMNVLKQSACGGNGIDPDLTFTIETLSGAKLVTYNTGKIRSSSGADWIQYGTFLTTPDNISTVIIRITNNAPGGCGNDLAIDDIMFRPCGPKIDAGIEGINNSDTTVCEPDIKPFTLMANYSALYQNPRVQWQSSTDNGNNWQTISGATSTTYTRPVSGSGLFLYRALIADGNNINLPNCRIASKPVSVKVSPRVQALASPDLRACNLSSVSLAASGGSSYAWTGPDGFTSNDQNPLISEIGYNQAGRYIVTVTNSDGCAAADTVNVQILQNVVISMPPPQAVCEGSPLTLTASGGSRIKWTPATGLSSDTVFNPVVRATTTTRYFATVSNSVGCTDTGSVLVSVFKIAKANAGPDLKILKGNAVQLKGTVSGTDISYSWTPPDYLDDPSLLNPTATPPSDMRYRLTATSSTGCNNTSIDEMEVKVFDFKKIPNTFTPNGDGYNDVWQVDQLRFFERCITEVYSAAGQLLYRDVGYSKPWDGTRNGKPLPAGTYYYAIDLKVEGFPKLAGYITILR
jgi:gliding motility-associated-like protein